MLRSPTITIAFLASVLLAGCNAPASDVPGHDLMATPTASAPQPPVATPAPPSEASPPVPPPPTHSGPASGLWLIDLASGAIAVLYEGDRYATTRGFEPDGASLWAWAPGDEVFVRYALDGTETERTGSYLDTLSPGPRCSQPDTAVLAATIDGRDYPVACGTFSGDGARMVYHVDIDPAGVALGRYEAWVLDLASGERTLATDQLRHCGGCGGRVGPAWSPSGRYLLIGETNAGADSRMYLYDTVTGEVRVAAEGQTVGGVGVNVRWSPVEDAFVAPGPGGSTVLERLPAGERMVLPEVPWPARFDPTGRLVYSPGGLWTADRPEDSLETPVADARTGETIASWEGTPANWLFVERGVTWTTDGPAAFMERVEGCDGTMLHHPVLDAPRCVEGAQGAAFSEETARIAYGREEVIDAGTARWEIVVEDVASGDARTVGE